MDTKGLNIIYSFFIFLFIIIAGGVYINISSHGYMESAIIYLSGIIGVSTFWISISIRNRKWGFVSKAG